MRRILALLAVSVGLLLGENFSVSHQIYSKLTEANKNIKAGKYSTARDILLETLRGEINPMEKDLTIYFYGNLHLIQKQYGFSKMIFEIIAKSKTLPKKILKEVHTNLAKLLIKESRYVDALNYLDSESVEKDTLLLLQVIYQELGEQSARVSVLHRLLDIEPLNIDYWKQLLFVYNRVGKSPKELSVNDIIFKITDNKVSGDIASNLVYLFSESGIPYQAGEVLQKSLQKGILKRNEENFKLLTYLYYRAKEYSQMEWSLKERVKLFNSSEAKAKLSELYIKMSRYRDAELLLLSLKNDREYLGQAYFNLGVVYFYQDQYKKARKEWLKATKFKMFKKRAERYLVMVKEYL